MFVSILKWSNNLDGCIPILRNLQVSGSLEIIQAEDEPKSWPNIWTSSPMAASADLAVAFSACHAESPFQSVGKLIAKHGARSKSR